MKSSDSTRSRAVSNPSTQQFLRSISRGRNETYDRVKAAVKSNMQSNGTTNSAFNSTSDYLRNLVQASGGGGPRRAVSASNLRSTTSSQMRQPEDMQEEIMHLKKSIAGLTNENVTLKTKVKKMETESMKKHKEIEELLDPTQRLINVHDKGGSKLAMNSMKQKLLRLEQTLKDKESALMKLKSDIKTTRIEEMRAQLETMYHEVLRLQRSQPTAADASLALPRELQARMKSMNDTILRLNETNEKLQSENKILRSRVKSEDNDADSDDQEHHNDYKKMTKDELIKTIARLEKKARSSSVSKNDPKKPSLTVSEEKLKDIIEERDKLKESMKKLKSEKQKQKILLDEKEKEISKLRREIEKLEEKLGVQGGGRQLKNKNALSPDSSPDLNKRKRNSSSGKRKTITNHSDKSSDSSPEISKKIAVSGERNKSKSSPTLSKKQTSRSSSVKKDGKGSAPSSVRLSTRQKEKLDKFTQNRAAKTIQRHWRRYQDDKDDEALSVIDSAAKAHMKRKAVLEKEFHSDDDNQSFRGGTATKGSDSGIDDAISVIGAAARGHLSRKTNADKLKEDERSVRSTARRSSTKASSKPISESDDDFFAK